MTPAALAARWVPGRGGRAADLIVATFAIYVLSLALPVMTAQIYDRVLPAESSGTLPILLIGVLVAIGLEIMLRLLRAYLIGWSGAAFEHRTSCAAVDHLMTVDLARLPQRGVATNVHSLLAIGQLKDFFSGQALTTLVEASLILVFLGFIGYIGGLLVLAPLGVLAVFVLLTAIWGWRLREALAGRADADDRRYDFLLEALGSSHAIKAFAFEKLLLRRYEPLQAATARTTCEVSWASAHLVNLGTVFAQIMSAAVMAAGALMVIEGALTIGGLIASLLLAGRIMQPVQKALLLWIQYQSYRLIAGKVDGLLAAPAIARGQAPAEAAGTGELTLVEVGLRLADQPPLFRQVELSLRPGEAIALAGAPGCGRSSLLKLIAGIYPPSEGAVLIDGVAATAYPPAALMGRVGLLSTEGVIFRGTIRDNLTRFGEVPEAKARAIAGMLGIEHDLARLPAGYDTIVDGTVADGIPPGLQQRIAIARVLAPRPRILLFDNADRGLDLHGYNLLYQLLGQIRSQIALILVSDDRNLLGLAARQLVLSPAGLVAGSTPLGHRPGRERLCGLQP
jgi:ATP-binding cassette subfamily C protein LapB